MKTNSLFTRCILLVVLLFVGVSCTEKNENREVAEALVSQMDSLIVLKDYFSVRSLFEENPTVLEEKERLRIGLMLDYAFNNPEASLEKTHRLQQKYGDELPDSLLYKIASITHVNYSRLYDYQQAKTSLQNLLEQYPDHITEAKRKDLENTLIIWTALQDQPKQQVSKQADEELTIKRDIAGLQNLEVRVDTTTRDFVFDTGANISTITQSTAAAFGVEVLEGSFDVNAITGGKVVSQIGIVPSFQLGTITIENAVFLIFPDEALAFPQIDYQIYGILGFPVLEALEEIQISRDDRFRVPLKPGSEGDQNLALDFLTPLLWLTERGEKGIYTFDTGANQTMLYNTYYQLHKTTLSNRAEHDYAFGGAGGNSSQKGVYTTFAPEISGRKIKIDSIIVLKEPLKEENSFLGNIGQDFIGKFNTMTLNFKEMYLKME